MRTQFEAILKQFFYEHQTKTRSELRLTQAQMAERLNMDRRSYTDLDTCKNCCSALTLISYLIYCCDDPMAFLLALYEAFKPLTYAKPRNLCLESKDESLSYRLPMQVTEIFATDDQEHFPVCPRCRISLEREYMNYCDRCGQRLDWFGFPSSAVIRTFSDRDHRTGAPD